MIQPAPGVAFTSESDGDMLDHQVVVAVSSQLGISGDWATVSQVHGNRVLRATNPGNLGPADAIVTELEGLPISVRTADCIGVVAHANGLVGVAHAGWRGLAQGVLGAFRDAMSSGAAFYVGPSIGPCCYEVGPEVASRFPDHQSTTTYGATSVDLRAAARSALGSAVWTDERCTHCGGDLPSYRRDGTTRRIAAIGWL